MRLRFREVLFRHRLQLQAQRLPHHLAPLLVAARQAEEIADNELTDHAAFAPARGHWRETRGCFDAQHRHPRTTTFRK